MSKIKMIHLFLEILLIKESYNQIYQEYFEQKHQITNSGQRPPPVTRK